jgi:hypothetical protein
MASPPVYEISPGVHELEIRFPDQRSVDEDPEGPTLEFSDQPRGLVLEITL